MVNLLVKDLIVMKRNIIAAIPFGFLFIALTQLNVTMSITVIAYMLVAQMLYQEDKSRTDIFVNCLPVLRKELVRSKYAGMVLFTLLAFLIVFAVSLVTRIVVPELAPSFAFEQALWAMITVLGFGAVIYPLSIVFSPMIIRYASVIFMLLYVMFFTTVQYGITTPGSPLSGMSSTAWLLAAGAAIAALYIVSYFISKTLYERKNL